ncbi:hypothetical protein F5Y15DRAFT_384085 [Xylariaceae sp. FL0016]|nr:hypothetical protein F5Y15DRAFT_384085 [Xylariaceae sp. FL0016]
MKCDNTMSTLPQTYTGSVIVMEAYQTSDDSLQCIPEKLIVVYWKMYVDCISSLLGASWLLGGRFPMVWWLFEAICFYQVQLGTFSIGSLQDT